MRPIKFRLLVNGMDARRDGRWRGFRKATPSQILTLSILSGVDILEAYKGFGIDVREVPAVKAQKLIDKLKEAEERRARQELNAKLATWFGVTTR